MISLARALALIAAVLCGSASEARAYDLTETEALRLLRAGPYHRELRARVEIARARSRQGTFYPNPSLSTTFESAGRTDFYMFEQPLALNGRLRLLSQAGESLVAAADSLAEHELRGIEAQVRRAFHWLAHAQRREHRIRAGIVDLRELHRILEERESAGEGSKFDRLRAEREIVERETELAGAEAAIAEAQASLASYYLGAGVDSDRLVANGTLLPAYPLPALADAVLDGLAARSDYRVEADRIREHEFRAAAAGRRRIPNPVVSGGLKRAEIGDRTASGPVLAVSIGLPVFDKGRSDRQLAEAEAAPRPRKPGNPRDPDSGRGPVRPCRLAHSSPDRRRIRVRVGKPGRRDSPDRGNRLSRGRGRHPGAARCLSGGAGCRTETARAARRRQAGRSGLRLGIGQEADSMNTRVFSVMLLALGCAGPQPEPTVAEEEGPEPVVVTLWSDRTELFVEFPPLRPGETSRFAVHLTDLKSFEPLREGSVDVRLDYPGGESRRFVADTPSRPGIFGGGRGAAQERQSVGDRFGSLPGDRGFPRPRAHAGGRRPVRRRRALGGGGASQGASRS